MKFHEKSQVSGSKMAVITLGTAWDIIIIIGVAMGIFGGWDHS